MRTGGEVVVMSKKVSEVKKIPISVDKVKLKTISECSTDVEGNLHIGLSDGFEIFCHDVIGDGNQEYSPEIRSVYSEMKLSNKKGWILKDVKIDQDLNDIVIFISPQGFSDSNPISYKFKMIDEEPLKKV